MSQLPPSLPITRFVSSETWNPQRIGALAIYCSDGRWGNAFDEFCHRSLSIPRYDRFAVPGGAAWLTQLDNAHPELFNAAKDQLEFLVRVHGLERIVLITHYGCAHYADRLGLEDADEVLPHQMKDLCRAEAILKEWFKDIDVEKYLAMRRDNVVSFHEA